MASEMKSLAELAALRLVDAQGELLPSKDFTLPDIGCTWPECACKVPMDNWSHDKRWDYCEKYNPYEHYYGLNKGID
jgi:hypothetical protein